MRTSVGQGVGVWGEVPVPGTHCCNTHTTQNLSTDTTQSPQLDVCVGSGRKTTRTTSMTMATAASNTMAAPTADAPPGPLYIDTQHDDMVHDAQLDYYGCKLATSSSGRWNTEFALLLSSSCALQLKNSFSF